jgi:hypothetical protein
MAAYLDLLTLGEAAPPLGTSPAALYHWCPPSGIELQSNGRDHFIKRIDFDRLCECRRELRSAALSHVSKMEGQRAVAISDVEAKVAQQNAEYDAIYRKYGVTGRLQEAIHA